MEEVQALVPIREAEAVVAANPNDDDLAEEVQLQELLFFQLHLNQVSQSPNEVLEAPLPQGSDILNMTSSNALMEDPIDPKGKQPVELQFSFSTITQGECSKHIHDTFNCPICMELIPTEEGFNINTCDHIFCNSCMIHYITVKIEENIFVIPCPTPGCKTTSVDLETCHHILPSDTIDRWSLALYELSVGLNKLYCPFKDCSALLIDEGEEEITNCECPYCHRMFCAKCKIPWHGDMSCEEFKTLGQDERGREDLLFRNLAKDKRWQRCPKCKMFVEKIDGCMFMKCRCGNCFCYACGNPMSGDTHYCERCRR